MAFEIPITWTPLNLAWTIVLLMGFKLIYSFITAKTKQLIKKAELDTIRLEKEIIVAKTIGFQDVEEIEKEEKKTTSGVVKGIMRGLMKND